MEYVQSPTCGCLVVKMCILQLVDPGPAVGQWVHSQVESYQEALKSGIYSFPALTVNTQH